MSDEQQSLESAIVATRRNGNERSATYIAIASGYVFICCFLVGPIFGFIFILIFTSDRFGYDILEVKPIAAAYAGILVFGGIQGYRAGLRLTEFLDRNGYISISHVWRTTIRVAFTPAALVALGAFFGAWAAHNLTGLLLWPAAAFAFVFGMHAFAALGVGVTILPLMRR